MRKEVAAGAAVFDVAVSAAGIFHYEFAIFHRNFGSLQSRQLVDLLNARQRIYGVCRTYDNTNAAERISDSQISEMLSWGSPLLFFLAAADTTQDNRLLVDNAILDARLHQTYPALLIHLDADVARIQQLLLSSRKNL